MLRVRDGSSGQWAVAGDGLVVGLQPFQRLSGRAGALDDRLGGRVPLGARLEPNGSDGRGGDANLGADVRERGRSFVAQPKNERQ